MSLKKEFKINNDFIPCVGNDGDEIFRNGIFEFNVTKILEFIQQNLTAFPLGKVAVNDFPKEFSSINESHMESVEISKPVILAEISPTRYNLIDGNHRMEKARRLGIEKMSAYKLNAEQHINFLTNKKAYFAYVEYWNSKLE